MMARGQIEIRCTEYRIVFFPVATLRQVGNISRLSVLGLTVYERAGEFRQFLGFVWRG